MAIPKIYTIGFTGKDAEEFFETLRDRGIRRLLDVRLHNTSQLAGFSKKRDLAYFLKTLLGAEYVHDPDLAPTEALLRSYQKGQMTWEDYAQAFNQLLLQRRPERKYPSAWFLTPTVLLCSEATAERCHRRLVAEHLVRAWGEGEIWHL